MARHCANCTCDPFEEGVARDDRVRAVDGSTGTVTRVGRTYGDPEGWVDVRWDDNRTQRHARQDLEVLHS